MRPAFAGSRMLPILAAIAALLLSSLEGQAAPLHHELTVELDPVNGRPPGL